MNKRQRARKRMTFTKKTVRILLAITIVDLQLSYLLAFLGREQIAETLSVAVVTEIIAVMLGYFIKSFQETKEEEDLNTYREEKGLNQNRAG